MDECAGVDRWGKWERGRGHVERVFRQYVVIRSEKRKAEGGRGNDIVTFIYRRFGHRAEELTNQEMGWCRWTPATA